VKTPTVEAAETKAKSVELLGVNVTPETVAEVVWSAVRNQQVHRFATPDAAAAPTDVGGTPWESRRDFVKSIAGCWENSPGRLARRRASGFTHG